MCRRTDPKITSRVLCEYSVHYLLNASALQRPFPLVYDVTSTQLHRPDARAKPPENFPRVPRSEPPLDAETVQSHIFHREIANEVHASKHEFHLSPNEAFTDPVSKLRCNKLLPANINEICSLIAKQVDLDATVFHDQVCSKCLFPSFMQQEFRQTGAAV